MFIYVCTVWFDPLLSQLLIFCSYHHSSTIGTTKPQLPDQPNDTKHTGLPVEPRARHSPVHTVHSPHKDKVQGVTSCFLEMSENSNAYMCVNWCVTVTKMYNPQGTLGLKKTIIYLRYYFHDGRWGSWLNATLYCVWGGIQVGANWMWKMLDLFKKYNCLFHHQGVAREQYLWDATRGPSLHHPTQWLWSVL